MTAYNDNITCPQLEQLSWGGRCRVSGLLQIVISSFHKAKANAGILTDCETGTGFRNCPCLRWHALLIGYIGRGMAIHRGYSLRSPTLPMGYGKMRRRATIRNDPFSSLPSLTMGHIEMRDGCILTGSLWTTHHLDTSPDEIDLALLFHTCYRICNNYNKRY